MKKKLLHKQVIWLYTPETGVKIELTRVKMFNTKKLITGKLTKKDLIFSINRDRTCILKSWF